MGVKKLSIILGEYFIVTRPFRYEGNVFHRGDVLRVTRIYDGQSKVLVSNKSWITTKVGHTEKENQYSFGAGTNWNIDIEYLFKNCVSYRSEWE